MNIIVTYPPHTKLWFHDLARAVTSSFQTLKYIVKLIPTYNVDQLTADLVFVLAPHGYHEGVSRPGLKKKRGVRYACWDMEQTPLDGQVSEISWNHFERALKYYYFFDYFFTESEGKTRFWIKQGFNVHTLNVGYHPIFTYPVVKTGTMYDVFFLGTSFSRRSKILDELRRRKLNVYPPRNIHVFDPKKRAQAIRNSRVCLNIHHNELQYFEKPRIITEIMANKGFCITEEIRYFDGFKNGNQFVMIPYEKMVDTIYNWVITDQSERNKYIVRAWNYISSELLMVNELRKVSKIWK